MVWFILSFIALLISGVMLAVLGGGGGMILLVTLNGFSEANASLILTCFALLVAVTNVTVATFVNSYVAKKWFAEAAVPVWLIIVLNISVMMSLVICLTAYVILV